MNENLPSTCCFSQIILGFKILIPQLNIMDCFRAKCCGPQVEPVVFFPSFYVWLYWLKTLPCKLILKSVEMKDSMQQFTRWLVMVRGNFIFDCSEKKMSLAPEE